MMTRFLLAALCVLLAAAPASAECAWVLWEQAIDVLPTKSRLERWTILQTYDARAECRADLAKLMHPNSAWRVGFEQLAEDKIIKRFAGEAVWTRRVLCVPGTLDPREGAKAK